MPKISLSASDMEFIRQNHNRMCGADMATILGHSKGVVNRFQKANGLTTPKSVSIASLAEKKRLKTTATPQEDEFIKANYLTMPVKQMCKALGRSDVFFRTRFQKLGLIIPSEVIEQRKFNSQLKKGNVPLNKGKKMDPKVYERIKHTFFQPGHSPKNTLFDGAIVIRHNHKERGAPPYKLIKLSKNKWEFLHRYNWVQAHGPIPNGMIIVFKNGDTMNCELANLECITFEENMIRNSYHFKDYDKEIKGAAYSITLLNKTIKELENEHKKQNRFK